MVQVITIAAAHTLHATQWTWLPGPSLSWELLLSTSWSWRSQLLFLITGALCFLSEGSQRAISWPAPLPFWSSSSSSHLQSNSQNLTLGASHLLGSCSIERYDLGEHPPYHQTCFKIHLPSATGKTAANKGDLGSVSHERRISKQARQWAKPDLFKSETSCRSSQEGAPREADLRNPWKWSLLSTILGEKNRTAVNNQSEHGEKTHQKAGFVILSILSSLFLIKQNTIRKVWLVNSPLYSHDKPKLRLESLLPCYSCNKTGNSGVGFGTFILLKVAFGEKQAPFTLLKRLPLSSFWPWLT